MQIQSGFTANKPSSIASTATSTVLTLVIGALLLLAMSTTIQAHEQQKQQEQQKQKEEQRPPNIVLLLGDDHGYPYFGFMGDTNVHTPTMDQIAAGGYTTTQGMVTTPYCRPSLRSIITGMHSVDYQLHVNRELAPAIAESEE